MGVERITINGVKLKLGDRVLIEVPGPRAKYYKGVWALDWIHPDRDYVVFNSSPKPSIVQRKPQFGMNLEEMAGWKITNTGHPCTRR